MAVSRRRFLGVAAAIPWAVRDGFARGALRGPMADLAAHDRDIRPPRCVLADLGDDCALPESVAGFERGLSAASVGFERLAAGEIPFASLILAPGAVLRSPQLAETLRGLADQGATVVYESGAAYADAEDFAREQRLLARYFGLDVEDPVELWGAHAGRLLPPYVQYDWPSRAIVRDFSRACFVRSADTPIANCAGFPVASYQRFGRGVFVYLGSPLGPHLNTGDPEALVLLRALASPS